MGSTVVIKVGYGDTLRRFNAHVAGNEQLEMNMLALREKVAGLLNLPPDTDFRMTYVDVDGDVVTLVDDDDLHDVMRQCLNPFRINVLVNNDGAGRSLSRSSGTSTPSRSSNVQHQLPNVNNGLAEILKALPQPYVEALSKLSLDLASKAASSAPALVELIECFSKLGYSHQSSGFWCQDSASTRNGAAEGCPNPSANKHSSSSRSGQFPEKFPETVPICENSQKVGSENVVEGVENPASPTNVDLNAKVPCDSTAPRCTTVNLQPVASEIFAGDRREEVEKVRDVNVGNVLVGTSASKSDACPVGHSQSGPFYATDSKGGPNTQFPWSKNSTDSEGGLNMQFPCSKNFSALHPGPYPLNGGCPFSGMPVATNSSFPAVGLFDGSTHKSSFSHCDDMGGMFHKGVRCDGCGAHPIIGPRYKSKVKEDYDLCDICFSRMGNMADYVRIDRPGSFRHPQNSWVQPPMPPQIFRGCGLKASKSKLDSCFILDVNVLDGTVMAPLTPFTKIWRMRNNGSSVWPQGTQLVWNGGDKLRDASSFEVEIPVVGVPPGEELDIAVDFRAPEWHGQYISYWRMKSPTGQKFGQRIWVLIQVDSALKHPANHDMNVTPVVDDVLPVLHEPIAAGEHRPSVEEPLIKEQEHNFPTNDALLVGCSLPDPVPPVIPSPIPPSPMDSIPAHISSSVSYPIIDHPNGAPSSVASHTPVTTPTTTPTTLPASEASVENVPASSAWVSGNDIVEQTLLKELEEMGFWQVDLNKEVLRMNEYNLEKSVDDLCGVADWDSTLQELEEMGFCDNEMNKLLLIKNNGSIKGVVMNLVAGEE